MCLYKRKYQIKNVKKYIISVLNYKYKFSIENTKEC